nr:hypothetical protein [Tanacetum cinerariifolium]
MDDTLIELLEVCWQKEFYCMHNDVDGLIESVLNSKLLSINLRSQHLDKKKQEVENIVEQPTKRGTQPEYSLSMGYEHLSIIPEMELDEVIKSSVKNLVLIPSECEVTSDDESECDVPIKDESSLVFTTFSNLLFDCNDDFTSSDDESLSDDDVLMEDFKVYSNPIFDDEESNSDKIDPLYFNVESNLIKSLSNRDTLFDSSQLLVNDSIRIPKNKSSYSDHHDDPSFPQPPPEPPDVEFFFDLEPDLISVMKYNIDEFNEDEYFDPGSKIDVFANIEGDDYFPFIFVI